MTGTAATNCRRHSKECAANLSFSPLKLDGFDTVFGQVMDEQQRAVLQSAVADALELQRCLHGLVAKHACCAIERLSVFVQALQEEEGVIEARHGKAWRSDHHVSMEIRAVLVTEVACFCRQRIQVVG